MKMPTSMLLFLLVMLSLAGCSPEQGAEPASEAAMTRIEGTVFYRERMLLPPGTQVEVQLEDISRADAPAEVLASVLMTPDTGPPYPFAIDYAAGQADTRGRYALRARIEHEGQLLFTNTEYIDPFGGNPVEILVQRVQSSAPSGPELEGTEWELASLAGSDTAKGAGDRVPDLLLDAEQQRAAGFSGCNRYFGGYQREGNPTHGSPLSFGQLAGTLMACAEGGELERAYLQALSQVNAFRIADGRLQLLQNDQVLATFTARQ